MGIKVYMPSKVTSSINGYELLLRLQNDLSAYKNNSIELSFRNVLWLEANLTAIVGAIIEDLENRGNVVSLTDCDYFQSRNDILTRNGFFPYYGVSIPQKTYSSTQIAYKKFKEKQSKAYNEYIQNELIENTDFPRHSKRLGDKIKENIYELFENARTHGKCQHIHTCGQFYPSRKKLHITIVDTGHTIVNNVKSYLQKPLLPSDCIEWAMKTGHTTKDGSIPGGLGLGLIFDFINLNKGKIQIVSSNGYWELREGNISKENLNFSFNGTIANLEFDISENKLYLLREESIDLDSIF